MEMRGNPWKLDEITTDISQKGYISENYISQKGDISQQGYIYLKVVALDPRRAKCAGRNCDSLPVQQWSSGHPPSAMGIRWGGGSAKTLMPAQALRNVVMQWRRFLKA